VGLGKTKLANVSISIHDTLETNLNFT